ncbi:MAG: UDP-N-acetylmuramate dehydrogenase [Rhodospirillaceae bacterium]|nr:UDP-N-acetylmuramate dehydrogenase [Rhodospirillaceae bacterium]
MAAVSLSPGDGLLARLPAVRGRLTADAPLGKTTWFRVGGPAEVLFRPADREDLAAFLAGCPADVPVTVIGVASNLLVRDGGVPGVVIRLGRGIADIVPDAAAGRVTAGAAALDVNVAKVARDAGLAGLEFLAGIPGTIGGAVRMNAGAYGGEVVQVLEWAEVVDRAGQVSRRSTAQLGLSYRHSDLVDGEVVTAALFRAEPGQREEIGARIVQITEARGATQPIRSRTGGSTFANPPGEKAWALIDRAGCRGLRLGGAQVSEQHTNFLINTGDATAAELEALGEEVRRRVREMSGIELRWEIRRIGVAADSKGEIDG